MSTEFFNDQWRIPSNENQNKISNYSMDKVLTNSKILSAGSSVNGTSEISVSIWFKSTSLVDSRYIWSFPNTDGGDGFNLRTAGAGTQLSMLVKGFGNNAFLSGTFNWSDGNWHHIVVTYDGATLKFYTDGSLNGSHSITTTISNALNEFYVGAFSASYLTLGALGSYDQVTVFDYALSQDQVTQLGAKGYAFNFDTDRIDIANGSTIARQQNISYSAWINATSLSITQYIVGNNSSSNKGTSIFLLNDVLVFQFGDLVNFNNQSYLNSRVSNLSNYVNANEWFHVAASWDGTDSKIYINGIERNSWTPTQPPTYTISGWSNNFVIGRRADSISGSFYGELSNIAFWNSVLTPAQVQTIYNNGAPGNISSLNPAGWWKLDDTATFNSGTSVWSIPDASTNSNTGASVGMDASNLVASNIDGELISNPMALNPKPIAYYQLGDQSVDNGANYLVPNNSLSDYVFNFDGTNDFIDCGNNNSLQATTELSISAWIKYTSDTADYRFIVSRRDFANTNYQFYLLNTTGGSKQLRFVSSGGLTSTGSVTINNWHHVAVTANGGNISFYIDGQPAGTGTIASINSVADKDFMIGNIPVAGVFEFPGSISNVAFWNTALTSTQVETLYNNGSPSTDISSLSPVSWWKLNAADTFDGTNWTINDYGSGGNDGTSSGMTSANLVTSDLQQTSGYSPYALSFDGTNQEFDIPSVSTLELYNTDFTISFWCKVDANVTNPMFFEKYTGGGGWSLYVFNDRLRFFNGSSWFHISGDFQTVYAGLWTNVTIVGDLASTNLKCYINGNQVHSSTNSLIQIQNTNILTMAGSNGNAFSYAGELSNVAIWSGTALNAAQVTEVYNQGVPINLNTFSGNKPNHWWQLGSNSSFNSNSWTCLDEGISASTNPLTSAVSTTNMSNDDIVDGVGYSASGLGTSSIDIKGDAPYSTANGLSENMDVLDRVKDVPS